MQFLDLSDYGRIPARFIANLLKNTYVTPIHVTCLFMISGLVSIYFIFRGQFILAALFLILKSILDAADGELARVKNTPSYSGRYLDSIFDILLNFMLLLCIGIITQDSMLKVFIAFVCIQLQGTLYNYYYVILRHRKDGDDTSRILESQIPRDFPNESQKVVFILYIIYNLLYRIFDLSIYWLDRKAVKSYNFPSWFMTMVSVFGLGFQLMIIGAMLVLDLQFYILNMIILLTVFIPIFLFIRKKITITE